MRFPTAYVLGVEDPSRIAAAVDTLRDPDSEPFILIGLRVENWNDMCSPWREPRIGKNLGPFGGGGPVFLDRVEREVKPVVDTRLRTLAAARYTAAAGYSLAGLLVLYSAYTSRTFSRFACISGSLWFPGWTDYAQTHRPVIADPRLYLSLGDQESRSRNRVMAAVGDCTRRTADMLAEYGVLLEYNPGGHFSDEPERIAKGLLYVMSDG
jgi:predicted alpha/beta superfamily hydrolase